MRQLHATTVLRAVKALHTAVWAFFAGCIVLIPLLAWHRQFAASLILIALVTGEVLVLVGHRLRCPLTNVAARYTEDRRDNFDIYLPEWLAKHNKVIFGSAFVAGILLTLALWQGWIR